MTGARFGLSARDVFPDDMGSRILSFAIGEM
jgi:hypothetical protein